MPTPPLKTYLITLALAGSLAGGAPLFAAEPTALIEEISGGDGQLSVMDYVTPGRSIDLGAGGKLVISYIDSCKTETISGGVVTVGLAASEVEGGTVETVEAACQGSGVVLAAGTQDAAGTVYRVSAFQGADWDERTIKGERPIFRWSSAAEEGLAALVILDMDQDPPAVVWRGTTDATTLAYPADAPPLEVGIPYQAQLTLPGGKAMQVTFSIDPGLEGPDTAVSRLVPIRPKPESAQ